MSFVVFSDVLKGFSSVCVCKMKKKAYLIQYQPKTKNDLCIDKRKLAALDDWFHSIYVEQQQNKNRILVLHGPTGCGKTSAVFCLAKHYDVKLFEFEEKTQTFAKTTDERQNTQHVGKQMDQMESFVTIANSSLSKKERERRKAIVIKDLPSTFLSKVDQFHEFLRNYLTCFKRGSPIIFIITIDETMNSTDFKRLFPPELYAELSLYVLELNAVAKKQMRSILERINVSGLVSKRDLEILIEASNGDVRSAINALEFIVESDRYCDEFEFKCPKSDGAMAIKDTSPTFFHMLGKIMYCKRDGDEMPSRKRRSSVHDLNASFDFDRSFDFNDRQDVRARRRKLKESPEALVDHIDSNGDTLSLFIHESYLDFVDDDFDSASNIVANLSFVDSHFSDWQDGELDDYRKLLAVRGTMFNLNTKEPVRTKRHFKQFNRPKYYSILKEEDAFTGKIVERSSRAENRFRTRDELMEILCYKDKSLFVKLC